MAIKRMEEGRTDMELLEGIRQGDRAAFGELYARYSDLIYRHVLVRVRSSFDADDIFQSFFLEVWERRETIRATSSARGYLLAWLKHHVLNTIREEQVRTRYEAAGQEGWSEASDYTWKRIVAADLDEKLRAVVEKFPPRLKAVWLLSREENLPVREIAERLGVSEQTVKNQLTDALRRLRAESGKKNFVLFL